MSSVPQFEGINSLALHLLYGTALTTVRGHWGPCLLFWAVLFTALTLHFQDLVNLDIEVYRNFRKEDLFSLFLEIYCR